MAQYCPVDTVPLIAFDKSWKYRKATVAAAGKMYLERQMEL